MSGFLGLLARGRVALLLGLAALAGALWSRRAGERAAQAAEAARRLDLYRQTRERMDEADFLERDADLARRWLRERAGRK